MMAISDFFKLIVNNFEYPWVVFLMIPAAIILYVVIHYDFIRIKDFMPYQDEGYPA